MGRGQRGGGKGERGGEGDREKKAQEEGDFTGGMPGWT